MGRKRIPEGIKRDTEHSDKTGNQTQSKLLVAFLKNQRGLT